MVSLSYVLLRLNMFDNTLSLAGYIGDILSSELVREYEDMIIHMKTYNRFQESDIELNKVFPVESAPGFVEDYERMLDSKPALAGYVRQFLNQPLALPGDGPQVGYFVELSVCFTFLMVSSGN
jgi:hypothetical protein